MFACAFFYDIPIHKKARAHEGSSQFALKLCNYAVDVNNRTNGSLSTASGLRRHTTHELWNLLPTMLEKQSLVDDATVTNQSSRASREWRMRHQLYQSSCVCVPESVALFQLCYHWGDKAHLSCFLLQICVPKLSGSQENCSPSAVLQSCIWLRSLTLHVSLDCLLDHLCIHGQVHIKHLHGRWIWWIYQVTQGTRREEPSWSHFELCGQLWGPHGCQPGTQNLYTVFWYCSSLERHRVFVDLNMHLIIRR